MREPSGKFATGLAAGACLAGLLVYGSAAAVTDRQVGSDEFRCGRPSPLRDRLGEDYLDLDTSALELERSLGMDRLSIPDVLRGSGGVTTAEAARLGSLFQTLTSATLGAGTGYRVQCRGSGDGDPEAVLWRFELEQVERVDTLRGDTMITAFEHRFDVVSQNREHLIDDVLVAEVMTLPAASDWYLDEDGESLRSTLRARRRAASSAQTTRAYLVEIDWRLATSGRDLELAQTFYTNGVASERAVWRLTAR